MCHVGPSLYWLDWDFPPSPTFANTNFTKLIRFESVKSDAFISLFRLRWQEMKPGLLFFCVFHSFFFLLNRLILRRWVLFPANLNRIYPSFISACCPMVSNQLRIYFEIKFSHLERSIDGVPKVLFRIQKCGTANVSWDRQSGRNPTWNWAALNSRHLAKLN